MALSEDQVPEVCERLSQGEGEEGLSVDDIQQLLAYLSQVYVLVAASDSPDSAALATISQVETVLKQQQFDRGVVLSDTSFNVPVTQKINDHFYDLVHYSQGRLNPYTEIDRLSDLDLGGSIDQGHSREIRLKYSNGESSTISFGIYEFVSEFPDEPLIRAVVVYSREVFDKRFEGVGKELTALVEAVAKKNEVDLIYSFLSTNIGPGTPLETLVRDKKRRGYEIFDENVAIKFLNGMTRDSFEGSWLFNEHRFNPPNAPT